LNWQTHDRQFKSKRLVRLITHHDDDDDDMGMMNGDKNKRATCLWTRLIECGIELNGNPLDWWWYVNPLQHAKKKSSTWTAWKALKNHKNHGVARAMEPNTKT